MAGHRRRHPDVGDERGKVPHAPALCRPDGRRVGGARRPEADGEEDHRPVWMLLRQAQAVERRVDDADVAAARLEGEVIPFTPRHPQQVAEGAEDHVPPRGDGDGLVDQYQRRDADWTAGIMDWADFRRQQLIAPVLNEVCVWPPQISISIQGRVVTARIACRNFSAAAGSRYSSRDFISLSMLQLIEFVHRFEQGEHPASLELVDPGDGEADVDQGVVADLDSGDGFQADTLAYPAKIDLAHDQVVLAEDFDDLTGDPQAHTPLLAESLGHGHLRRSWPRLPAGRGSSRRRWAGPGNAGKATGGWKSTPT
jgi:hypothetical protein